MSGHKRSAHAHHRDRPHPHGPAGTRDRRAKGSVRVEVHRDLMAENDAQAAGIRSRLEEKGILAVNLISSPGAGKTSLLEATLARTAPSLRAAVIEGDIETRADADRLAAFSIPVVQINTSPFGGDCHLAAPLIRSALDEIDLDPIDILFIENVGNLVCPAEFDVGESHKVVLLSTTEGADKPLKYPPAFREADLALLTKIDLLPHLDLDMADVRSNLAKVNPDLHYLELSVKTGEGLDGWMRWLIRRLDHLRDR